MKRKQIPTSGLDFNLMLGLTERLKADNHLRDYLLIIMGCYFGLRISDLLSLKWEHVFEKHELLIQEKKTKKLRRITINPKVHQAIQAHVLNLKQQDNYSVDKFIFANRTGSKISVSYINKRLKFIFAKYNVAVKNPSSHTLRKTFGKRIYEADNKSERALVYLSEIFSHSSISITRKYIGITQEQISDMYLSL